MTEKNRTPQFPADAATEVWTSWTSAFTDARKSGIPEAARTFVKDGAVAAKEHTAQALAGAEKFTAFFEGAAKAYVSGVAEMSRKFVEALHQDAEAAVQVTEKLAKVASPMEAAQINADYVRERVEINVGRAKEAAAFASASFNDGVKTMQEGVSHVAPFARAA